MKQPLTEKLSPEELLRQVPRVIFAAEPGLEAFADRAWLLAYDHIKQTDGAPQSPFMDEACEADRIWIWDTCFMAHYCKYAPQVFPGIESLRNFYAPMLDGNPTSLKIHIPDNPPLFAWTEAEYCRLTGDRKHLEEVFLEKRIPQRFYALFEHFRYGDRYPYMSSAFPVQWEKTPMGYHWTGGRCGMDNTPRGDFPAEVFDNDPAYRQIFFVDAAAQQALAARIIHEVTGEAYFRQEFGRLQDLLNTAYWDEEDGCYYDIAAVPPHRKIKVMTPASYWPLLAGIASPEQAARMLEHAMDPAELGGKVPFPSVSRSSKHFSPQGMYWRGGVWLPTAYMSIKALEYCGFQAEADRLARDMVMHQYHTWREYEPHTIWEAYSPTVCAPSSRKHSTRDQVKPDFCGWSALGPINLMIENVLGIHADGVRKQVRWNLHHPCRHGITNLRFGGITADLIYEDHKVSVRSSEPFTLELSDPAIPVVRRMIEHGNGQ